MKHPVTCPLMTGSEAFYISVSYQNIIGSSPIPRLQELFDLDFKRDIVLLISVNNVGLSYDHPEYLDAFDTAVSK